MHVVRYRIVLQETRRIPPSAQFSSRQRFGMDAYRKLVADRKQTSRVSGAPGARDAALSEAFSKGAGRVERAGLQWFYDGELNASYNCLDRHLKTPARPRSRSSSRRTTARSPGSLTNLYHEVAALERAQGARQSSSRPVLVYMYHVIQRWLRCSRPPHRATHRGCSRLLGKSVQEAGSSMRALR